MAPPPQPPKPSDPPALQFHVPLHETVHVRCENDHPVRGLYVVWRLRRAVKAGAAAAANADILKLAGADADETDPEHRFVVGMSDAEGFLRPVRPGTNPRYEVSLEQVRRTFKVSEKQKYVGCLIRHSDPRIAIALAQYLDKDPNPSLTSLFREWMAKAQGKLEELKLERDNGQLVLRAPEKADAYWPRGSSLYDGWTLFDQMPHESCEPVVKCVKRLQAHLGALRYPVGIVHSPYAPVERKSDPKFVFDTRTASAVEAFQEDAKAGQAFAVASDLWAQAHDRFLGSDSKFEPKGTEEKSASGEGWAFLVGKKDQQLSGAAADAGTLPAFVGEQTGAAIQAWIKNGFRKPGPILVSIDALDGPLWMREELALQMLAWRELFRSFGGLYTIEAYSGLALRDTADMESGKGKALCSIHKCGLAIDLLAQTFQTTFKSAPAKIEVRDWGGTDWAAKEADAKNKLKAAIQRRTEAEARLTAAGGPRPAPPVSSHPPLDIKTAEQRVQTAWKALSTVESQKPPPDPAPHLAKIVSAHDDYVLSLEEEIARYDEEIARAGGHRVHWMLYGHSELDPFGAREDTRAKLLRQFVAPSASARSPYVQRLLDQVKGRFRATGDDGRFLAWFNEVAESYARCDSTQRHLVERLSPPGNARALGGWPETWFRREVYPFAFNEKRPDGGGNASSPEAPSAVRPNAKSFVNLTTLAHLCAVESIPASGDSWKLQWSDPLPAGARLKEIAKLVKAIQPGQGASAEEEKLPVLVRRAGQSQVELDPSTIDCELMTKWAEALETWAKPAAHAVVEAPEVTLTAAYWTEARAPLGSDPLASAKLIVLDAGEGLDLKVGDVLSGKDLDTKMQAIEDAEHDDALVWVRVQPFFDQGSLDAEDIADLLFRRGDEVVVRQPGVPRSREWWHYQSRWAANKSWSLLMKQIGYADKLFAATREPPRDLGPEYLGPGFGYPPDKMASTRTATAPDAVNPEAALTRLEDNNPWEPAGAAAGSR